MVHTKLCHYILFVRNQDKLHEDTGIFTHSYTIYTAIYIHSESSGTTGSTLQTIKINAFVIYYYPRGSE